MPIDKDTVDSTSVAYKIMEVDWKMVSDLLGGTRAMRNAGTQWLTQFPKEKKQDYDRRIADSYLYNMYRDTCKRLTAKPYSKPIQVKQDKLPDYLQELKNNADNQGNSLTQFGRYNFMNGVSYGKSHILVDYPLSKKQMNLAEERKLGIRPYFSQYDADSLIGWKTRKTVGGMIVPSQVRLKETRVEAVGVYGEEEVDYIRVINEDSFEIYKYIKKDKTWILDDIGVNTLGEIPIRTFYTMRTGFFTAELPLEDLAWLNLAHWNSYSDHRNIMRFARLGILWATGITEEEQKKGIEIGVNHLASSTNTDAKLGYVEYAGSGAVKLGMEELKMIEEKGEILGMQPLLRKSGQTTATGQEIDEEKTTSDILSWVRGQEAVITDCYRLGAKWKKDTLPDDFTANIHSEFGLSMRVSQDVESLIKMRTSKEIDRETFLTEVKKRGVLGEETEVKTIMDKLEIEGPDFSDIEFDSDKKKKEDENRQD